MEVYNLTEKEQKVAREVIEAAIAKTGRNYAEIAERCGVSYKMMMNILGGHRDVTVSFMETMAKGLRIRMNVSVRMQFGDKKVA